MAANNCSLLGTKNCTRETAALPFLVVRGTYFTFFSVGKSPFFKYFFELFGGRKLAQHEGGLDLDFTIVT